MLRYSTRLFYFVCLIFVSSASFATITFEGSLGVKQALSSCTGCHYGADAPDACLNTDDQGGVATGWYHNDGSDAELYDMENDPREMTNLIDRPHHRERIHTMRLRLIAHAERSSDPLLTWMRNLFVERQTEYTAYGANYRA